MGPRTSGTCDPPTPGIGAVAGRDGGALGGASWAVVITLLAVLMRGWHAERIAIEHFDEAVYASNVWLGNPLEGGGFPMQHLYAPPLVPTAIEMSCLAFGPSDLACVVPGFLAGVLTVMLVFLSGWRWFGLRAGVGAGVVLCGCEFHIAMSRTALTDPVLVFWLTLALVLAVEFLRPFGDAASSSTGVPRQRWGFAVGAGVVTALAWRTKYNGWLPLAITAIAMPVVLGLRGFGHRSVVVADVAQTKSQTAIAADLLRAGALWGAMLLPAVAAFAMWVWLLQPVGGYSSVLDNHRGYIVGLSGWWSSAMRQHENLTHFNGWCGGLCFCLTPLAIGLCGACRSVNGVVPAARTGPALGIKMFEMLVPAVLASVGFAIAVAAAGAHGAMLLCGIAGLLVPRTVSPGEGAHKADSWAARGVLAVWLVLLAVLVPCYTPYPRLLLPLFIPAAFGCGRLIERWLDDSRRAREAESAGAAAHGPKSLTRMWYLPLAVGVWLLIFIARGPGAWDGPSATWNERDGFRQAAERVREAIARRLTRVRGVRGEECAIAVYGEPALWWHLRRDGFSQAFPVGSATFLEEPAGASGRPRFLVRRGDGSPEVAAGARVLARWPTRRSPLCTLDESAGDRRPPSRGESVVEEFVLLEKQ